MSNPTIPPYDEDRLLQLQRAFMVIAVLAIVVSTCTLCTSCSQDTAFDPSFSECASGERWTWAECLPSLVPGGADCPGEKVSRAIYDSTGRFFWRYHLTARRFQGGCVLYDLECMDSPGSSTGIDAWSIPVYGHVDPITGQQNRFDRYGYVEGHVFVIEGLQGPDGRVNPLWWNISPELR